jgi:protein-S-isoprenylcysteine O-methyltransferase Ste14
LDKLPPIYVAAAPRRSTSSLGPINVNFRTLELKIPPPAVAVFAAIVMWGVSRATSSWEIPALARIGVALAIAAIGVAFSVSGVIAFRRAKTTINPTTPEAASSLVSSGVYRATRNPMYVGLLLVLVAWAVFLSSGWALPGPLVFAAYIRRFQITPEERVLSALFGTEYSAYKARVRRWL